MWIQMDAKFRADVERYKLAFTCEACANFCEARDDCSILYPTEPHRAEKVNALTDGERVFFCKMFEAV